MSEGLGLGDADGESRWIGVRRHQAVLVILGLGFLGEWFTRSRGALIEPAIGVALLACAASGGEGLTIAERVWITASFLLRSRWTSMFVSAGPGSVIVQARGEAMTRGFEFQHHGRLDLTGRDRRNAEALSDFADALATTDETRHFSLHVRSSDGDVATLLAVPRDANVPAGWTERRELVLAATCPGRLGQSWLLERWDYVRDEREVMRVLRVRDFTSVPDGRALLERLQFASSSLDVAVHVDVVGGVRAHRLASRAVHRMGSDVATTQGAGFRRTARSTRALERLRQREVLVVGGNALMRVAVFVVVRAPSIVQLRRDVDSLVRCAVESGLRCDTGRGRQSPWYCAQLPGAPGW